MAEEGEVFAEVEAVQSVYGDDCTVFDNYPLHLHVHIKPRTAEISSQQFVEAILAIRGGVQYPNEPPDINLIESKGLDGPRQKHLLNCISELARELSSCQMLVALIEEAVERLTIMNHPEGDCPLCLYPLVPENEFGKALPFMKLMSCFHCFHSECIIRWWNWLQTQKEENSSISSSETAHASIDTSNVSDMNRMMEGSTGLCPVCRKVFLAKDLEHVQDLVGIQSLQLSFHGDEADEDQELIESNSERIRRQKYDTILRLQQENCGIIEPKKDLLVLPGMFLPQPSTSSTKEIIEQPEIEPTVASETTSTGPSNRVGTSYHRNSGARKHRARNPNKQGRQWIRRENGNSS